MGIVVLSHSYIIMTSCSSILCFRICLHMIFFVIIFLFDFASNIMQNKQIYVIYHLKQDLVRKIYNKTKQKLDKVQTEGSGV